MFTPDSPKRGDKPVVVIGAGPAGLTAAHELMKNGVKPLVFEKGVRVGGIARTEVYKGYRFDIGGHRFFTKVTEVQDLWKEVLGDDFIKVPRMSRIHYNGKFYHYPLRLPSTLLNLGPIESIKIFFSYCASRIKGYPQENTLEEWVSNRFGKRLYSIFFKTYTEKVWGIPCNKISADWAAQRIKGLSLKEAVLSAIFKKSDAKSLITEFDYPILGPGMMWEKLQDNINRDGGEVRMGTDITRVNRENFRIKSITIKEGDESRDVETSDLFNTMPITELVRKLDPPAPQHVLDAVSKLKYRDFLIVVLIVNKPELFPDNWIYVHSANVKVGRIQNFKNWSKALLPDQSTTSLGMEYFCNESDGLWDSKNEDLIALATKELGELKLANGGEVIDGCVIRQHKAYPVYDPEYLDHLNVIRDYLKQFENLYTVGRNGMFRYNNQDHSMLTAMLAVRNYMGEKHDLWEVNTERSYHEEFQVKPKSTGAESPEEIPVDAEPVDA